MMSPGVALVTFFFAITLRTKNSDTINRASPK